MIYIVDYIYKGMFRKIKPIRSYSYHNGKVKVIKGDTLTAEDFKKGCGEVMDDKYWWGWTD